jgi:uncharacterized membrane protein
MNSGPFVLLIGLLLIVAILVLFLPMRASRSKVDTSADRPFTGFRDDDRYWYGGSFYNNPDDPDLFVPKRYGMGWTINFGHPRGKLVLIGTLLVPLVLALLGILVPGFTHSYGCHPSGCSPIP